MDKADENKYLNFYKINFGTAKYCTKSWGLASFGAGKQSQQAKIDDLQARIDEVLKTCDNLRTDLIRENHVEYDKGWKDCATSIYHQLKGSKDEN